MEVRSVAEKEPRYRDGAARSAQRCHRNARIKPPDKLFEHEYRAGDRSAKCRGEPSACTGGEECFDIVLLTTKSGRKKIFDLRAYRLASCLPKRQQGRLE